MSGTNNTGSAKRLQAAAIAPTVRMWKRAEARRHHAERASTYLSIDADTLERTILRYGDITCASGSVRVAYAGLVAYGDSIGAAVSRIVAQIERAGRGHATR